MKPRTRYSLWQSSATCCGLFYISGFGFGMGAAGYSSVIGWAVTAVTGCLGIAGMYATRGVALMSDGEDEETT